MALPYKKLTNKNDKKLKFTGIEALTSAPKSKETRNEIFDMSED